MVVGEASTVSLTFIPSLDRVVKEEISDDNARLPCFNGRVVSWVRGPGSEGPVPPALPGSSKPESGLVAQPLLSRWRLWLLAFLSVWRASWSSSAFFWSPLMLVNAVLRFTSGSLNLVPFSNPYSYFICLTSQLSLFF